MHPLADLITTTEREWKSASWSEILLLNQKYMLQHQDGQLYVTPYHFGPVDVDIICLGEALAHLHSYGLLVFDCNPGMISYSKSDTEWRQLRQLPYLGFLVKPGTDTENFFAKLKTDNRLALSITDGVSGQDREVPENLSPMLCREAGTISELFQAKFHEEEVRGGHVTATDLCLDDISAITEGGVYVCSVGTNVNPSVFKEASDKAVAKLIDKSPLFAIVGDYAQQTLQEIKMKSTFPSVPVFLDSSDGWKLKNVSWNAIQAPETARTEDGTELDLSKIIFLHPVTLVVEDRYPDDRDEDDMGNHDESIQTTGRTIHDVLLTIQKAVAQMDANAGEHRHGDNVEFCGIFETAPGRWVCRME